jgi:hypothetical protein
MELGRFMGVKEGTIRNGMERGKKGKWWVYFIIYVLLQVHDFWCMYFLVVGLECEIGPTYYQVDDGVT